MADPITIHAASPWEVELLWGRLEGEGIRTFVPDANAKLMDPFITGANALNVSLQVWEKDVERAVTLVREFQAAVREDDDEDEDQEEESPEARRERQTKQGRRIQWFSFLWFAAPIALVMGIFYILDLEPREARPSNHRLTLAALLIALLGTVAWVVLLRGCSADTFGPRT